MKTPIDIWGLGILKHISLWVDDGAVHLNGVCKLQVYIFRSLGCCNSPTIFRGGRGLQILPKFLERHEYRRRIFLTRMGQK